MQPLSRGASRGGAGSAGSKLIVGTAALASFAVGYALRAARGGSKPVASPHVPPPTLEASRSSSDEQISPSAVASSSPSAAASSSSPIKPHSGSGRPAAQKIKSEASEDAEIQNRASRGQKASPPPDDTGSLGKLKRLEAELARVTKDGEAKAAQHARDATKMSERVRTEAEACSELREELQQARVTQLAAVKRANDLHAAQARSKSTPAHSSQVQAQAKSIAAAAAFAEAQAQKLLAERHQLRQELSLQAARFAGELAEQREVDRQLHARALQQLEVLRESDAARALKQSQLLNEVAEVSKALRAEQQRSSVLQESAESARELRDFRAEHEMTTERLEASERKCAELNAEAVSARESEAQALGEKQAAIAVHHQLQLECKALEATVIDSTARLQAESTALETIQALEAKLTDGQASYTALVNESECQRQAANSLVESLRAENQNLHCAHEELELQRKKLQAAVKSTTDTLARVEVDAAAKLATAQTQLADQQQRDREQIRKRAASELHAARKAQEVTNELEVLKAEASDMTEELQALRQVLELAELELAQHDANLKLVEKAGEQHSSAKMAELERAHMAARLAVKSGRMTIKAFRQLNVEKRRERHKSRFGQANSSAVKPQPQFDAKTRVSRRSRSRSRSPSLDGMLSAAATIAARSYRRPVPRSQRSPSAESIDRVLAAASSSTTTPPPQAARSRLRTRRPTSTRREE